jgi:hypothetical protein
MTWLFAVVFRPIAALILYGLILLPAVLLVKRMPDCKLKRLLLTEIRPGGDADWSKQGSG